MATVIDKISTVIIASKQWFKKFSTCEAGTFVGHFANNPPSKIGNQSYLSEIHY